MTHNKRRRTLRERADESIRKHFGAGKDLFVWEHEREMWILGYRAARKSQRGV